MDELTIGDKIYISSKQAAKITGYAKDYVGQLCREGRVEARLVGRNWYVLESSIREHRFGKKVEAEEAEVEREETLQPAATWQEPTYKAEEPALVPNLAPKPAPAATGPAIADMQSAWREWFEERRADSSVVLEQSVHIEQRIVENTSEVGEPDPIEEAESAPEELVPLTRIEEEPVREPEPVSRPYEPVRQSAPHVLQHGAAPVMDLRPRQEPSVRREVRMTPPQPRMAEARTQSPWTAVARSLLLIVAAAAVLTALIGTGNAERLFSGTSLDYGVQKSIVDFLGGVRTYESSL